MNNKEISVPVRYNELDALRGMAALMVIFFHFVLYADRYGSIFILGTTGVDLFFMISGFVMLLSIQKITTAKQFIVSRFSRLYPTYWTAVTFTFILIVLECVFRFNKNSYDIPKYLGNMTMFQYYLSIPDLDGPYWTMIIEMLFYIVIIMLYQLNALKYLIPGGILCSITTTILCNYFYDFAFVKEIIYWFPLILYLPLFLTGTLFYQLYTKRTQIIYRYTCIVVCLLIQISLFKFAGRSNYYISVNQYSSMLIIYYILFALFIHGKLQFIVSSVTLFLGKISYALYLIHQHISLVIILPILTQTYQMNFWVACVLIDLPIVIGIAAVITYRIEIPFRKKIKVWLS
jgi:peptidoglycan/LPS O-acetylase OafA/YrhL